MADVPYADWFGFIRRHLPSSPRPVIELFSGPGEVAAAAAAAGYPAFCLDRHLPFLNGAGICADVSALPFAAGSCAALVATNCSINYFADMPGLERHFGECRRVLEIGGAYIFDVCPHERATLLGMHTFEALNGKVRFAHRYESARHILTTTVTISDNGVAEETHRQRIFSPQEITSAAEAATFKISEVVENYDLPVSGENYPVVTWVLRV